MVTPEPRTQPYSVVLMKCFLKYSTTYKLWLLIRPSVCVWCISIHCFQFYTFSNEMMLFCVMETCCSRNCQSIQMSVCHCSVFIVAECAPVSTCAVSTHHQGGDISVEIETIDCGSRPCDCGYIVLSIHRAHVVCGSQSSVVTWVGLIRTQLISLELSIDDNTNRRTLHWQTVVIILTWKIVPNKSNKCKFLMDSLFSEVFLLVS